MLLLDVPPGKDLHPQREIERLCQEIQGAADR
jgi:hypothetical protein